MREANFSIPSANKASVGITPALYDRRALDCTSTLPLINSLNNLTYLTTSSARIRDILTVDGGVERLVCILKEGRSKDAMESWKWNLAFQCVFNIGVRGSEAVRTRVVEADMVPVVATLLDNYIRAMEKLKKRADALRPTSTPTPLSRALHAQADPLTSLGQNALPEDRSLHRSTSLLMISPWPINNHHRFVTPDSTLVVTPRCTTSVRSPLHRFVQNKLPVRLYDQFVTQIVYHRCCLT